jgi:queuosine precursor transporter
VIWADFAGLGFASFMAAVVVALPPAPFWPHQNAYEVAFGMTWRIAAASTIAGEGVDSALFYPLAFYGAGIIPEDKLLLLMFSQFVAKVMVEVALTPVTCRVVGFLKRAENEDYYDRRTDFDPFSLRA